MCGLVLHFVASMACCSRIAFSLNVKAGLYVERSFLCVHVSCRMIVLGSAAPSHVPPQRMMSRTTAMK
jgi:hypothetical protein